ncbi:ribosome biogenesis GTPase Der [bacterium (Candidatus Blackallbacteria) CG17_big_fil_post_rev_8_21_14_2_50_48_46]|uniref:GTPase Der n=1 Tax=bacterium (Candidatus Blackallbacteria) CG17_big_fil_post_rev_8_21_14_2_50_48_46 TaxID=2014261 RepID=A0A2M7G991_9BACT|nr:MAG: ribosome biogenesis GTPase Der [bacterium (Candidatus Blackallbacteria) CG18_big_fil_WC_8_21_14_2_50_49_26]PIW18682.1 MAG: ribosome biogenesis GTPase Der [bacterium (Candidatus Blackallbacteria) CG17_big_fil_post_rev_8_21_14_2_50_48_46]PIW46332.1 MAG: ribosome biogenesis GTPase Der [bacterium (Candidatus Blackallbacteria) CG13_big_fil_rev_8_21_14_2_50_49_14]
MGAVNKGQLVAIVGRPNVGKSTLANRFVGQRMAIVDDMPGVTRDRLYLSCEWTNHPFIVIDTGGLLFEDSDDMHESVQQQAWLAVDEAQVIVFVVDGQTGLHPLDRVIADELRQRRKEVILAVNKLDDMHNSAPAAEFYELGLGDPHAISAIHSNRIGDLLDDIVEKLEIEQVFDADEEEGLKLAIVGRPNVGKSSIVNTLLGEKRMTVSNIPGTTRDAIDTVLKREGEKYVLIDTAGIRKKAKVRYGVERFSVVRAIKAIHRADVVVLVVDASEPVSEQDQRIAGMAQELGKACVIVVNKWDLIPDKDHRSMPEHADSLREKLYFLEYAPVVFTSTVTKKRLFNLLDVAKAASEENQRRITTGLFNEVLNEIVSMTPPPARKNRRAKISYGTQVSVSPPTFVLFSNHPDIVEAPYLRHVERKMRESFGFVGTPIRFMMREDTKRKERGQQRKSKPAARPYGQKLEARGGDEAQD